MMANIEYKQQINTMNSSHVDDVVAVHLKAFHGFTLSYMGERFLKEFYTGVIDDPTGIAFVLEDHQNLIGFVAGSTKPNGFYRRLLVKKWWRFGIAAFPAVLSKPRILPRLFRALKMPNEKLPYPNCATLMSIGVDPSLQRQGSGKHLVEVFIKESKERGVEAVNLKTDAECNDRVNQFYTNKGFKLFRTFTTPEGRVMNEYVYFLGNLGS